MNSILSEAFEKAAVLPVAMQEQIARQLIEDMDAELKWDHSLAGSQRQLAILADKALDDFKAGRGEKIGFDEL